MKERFKGIDIIDRMIAGEKFKCVSGHWVYIGSIYSIKYNDIIENCYIEQTHKDETYKEIRPTISMANSNFISMYNFIKSEFEEYHE